MADARNAQKVAPQSPGTLGLFRLLIGRRVARLLLVSFVLAVVMSWVEVGFSLLLQLFLVTLGVLSPEAAPLPAWLPTGLGTCMAMIIGFALVRSSIYWFKSFSHGLIVEAFAAYVRGLVARWALVFTDWDSARVVTLLNDRVTMSGNFVSGVHSLIINLTTGSVIFLYLIWASWKLAFFGLFALFCLGMALKSFDGVIRRESENVVRLSGEINARVLDSLRNLFFVRVCRFEEREASHITRRLDELYASTRLSLGVSSVKFAAPQFLGVVLVVLIAVAGKKLQLLEGGAFLSFIYLFVRVSQQIADLSSSTATVRMYYPHFRELFGWFREHRERVFAPARAGEALPRELAPASWSLSNVSLSLGKNEILRDRNFTIEAGKVTILRGPSGAGKSTVLSMIAGFLSPTSGRVVQGGAGLIRFGYVGPEPAVISGTIRENLLFGLDQGAVDDRRLHEVLAATSCGEFVSQHPDGLERRISDRGEGLSTGQKQRLSMARALLREPNVLLLDEPTANLDERSKTAIVGALQSLRGRTTIVIATHDDAIARIGDQVIQLEAPAR